MMRVIAIVLLGWVTTANAAEMSSCKVYANRGSAFALKQLLGLPFVDDAAGKFLFRKAYSYCLLQDEVPEINFTHEEQPIVDGLPPPGSVPATDLADPPAKVKVSSTDQPLCVRHHMRTIYSGKHWNCHK